MTEGVHAIRLVPRREDPERSTETFACSGIDDLTRALAALAALGEPVPAFAGLNELEETWLDTPDRRLLRANLILHVRTGAAATVARLTALAGPWPVDGTGDDFVQTLAEGPLEDTVRDPGPVGGRVTALAAHRPLEPHAVLAVRRSRFENDPGSSSVVLELDEIRCLRPARLGPRTTCRLTIAGGAEAAPRIEALIAALREPCALAPPPPFAETARELTGIEPLPEPDLGPEDVTPDVTAGALAFAGLRRQARAFLRNEPGTRLGDDPEALHDMRVAGRRLRAAFGLFESWLPKRGDALRRELGRLGRVLGAVRDLDVQLAQLETWRKAGPLSDSPAFDAIESVLRRRHAVARRRLLATLESSRYERFTARLRAFALHGEGGRHAHGRFPALAAAPELIGQRCRAVRKAGDRLTRESAPADFHALRIRAKRLRYALEFHRPLYDGDVAAMIEGLTAIQDLLGEHQDNVVAVGHLQELASEGGRKLPPRALFLMGAIAGRYERRAAKLRREFDKSYRKIRGRQWKALKSSLAAGALRSATDLVRRVVR